MRFSYGYNGVGAKVMSQDLTNAAPNPALGNYVGFSESTRQPLANREVRADRVRSPAEMIAIADRSAPREGQPAYAFTVWARDDADGAPADIHQGGANVLFCDGHVEWRRPAELTFQFHYNNPDETFLRVAPLWNSSHTP